MVSVIQFFPFGGSFSCQRILLNHKPNHTSLFLENLNGFLLLLNWNLRSPQQWPITLLFPVPSLYDAPLNTQSPTSAPPAPSAFVFACLFVQSGLALQIADSVSPFKPLHKCPLPRGTFPDLLILTGLTRYALSHPFISFMVSILSYAILNMYLFTICN